MPVSEARTRGTIPALPATVSEAFAAPGHPVTGRNDMHWAIDL